MNDYKMSKKGCHAPWNHGGRINKYRQETVSEMRWSDIEIIIMIQDLYNRKEGETRDEIIRFPSSFFSCLNTFCLDP